MNSGMGDYSLTASEILFNVDYKAYRTEHQVFTEGDEGVAASDG